MNLMQNNYFGYVYGEYNSKLFKHFNIGEIWYWQQAIKMFKYNYWVLSTDKSKLTR